MKNTNIYFLFILLCPGLVSAALNAQTSLLLDEINGTKSYFVLENVSKITFSDSSLLLTEMDKTSHSFSLKTIHRISFGTPQGPLELPPGELSQMVLVYPNPVHSEFILQLGSMPAEKSTLSLYNSQGKLMFSKSLTAMEEIISISGYPAGIYICRIFTNNLIHTQIIIKD